MSVNERTRALINGYCSGHLDSDELAEFEDILRQSSEARRMLAEYRGMESSMRALLGGVEAFRPADTIDSSMVRRLRFGIFAMAAAIALLLTLFVLLTRSADPDIATVVEMTGSVRWTGDGGRIVGLVAGDSINGGTIEAVSNDSVVSFTFNDGSLVTFFGRTVAVMSEDKRKHIYLKEGSISVDMEAQPNEYPALVETSTAEFEIIGTRFEVDAHSASSVLSVSEGSVLAIRKVDRSEVRVNENQGVIASLTPLTAVWKSFQTKALNSWESNFVAEAENAIGDWLPPDGDKKARLRAVPTIHEKPGWGPVVVYVAGATTVGGKDKVVQMASDSMVQVSGWVESAGSVEIMLVTNNPQGGFGGNFHYVFEATPEDRFTIEVPLSVFEIRARKELGTNPVGKLLKRIIVLNNHYNLGLQIERVAIQSGSDE